MELSPSAPTCFNSSKKSLPGLTLGSGPRLGSGLPQLLAMSRGEDVACGLTRVDEIPDSLRSRKKIPTLLSREPAIGHLLLHESFEVV